MKKTSIKDIADIAKVSTATVSRVLNSSPLVDEFTRDRVLKIIQEQNYKPSLIARSLIKGKTNLLTLIVPPTPNFFSAFYFTQIMNGISDAITRDQYRLMIYQPSGYDSKLGYPPQLEDIQMDGLFMIAPLMEDRLVKHLEVEKIPTILINARSHELDWIDLNNKSASIKVIETLVGLGHKKIGFIPGLTGYNTVARLEGYKAGLEKFSIRFDPSYIESGDYSLESGLHAAKKLLSLSKKPTAIYAANDLMAMGAMQSIREAGLSVPSDISVFGFDDSDAAKLSQPPLSTVKQPFYNMGKRAVQLLIERVEKPEMPPRYEEMEGEIILRQTTKKI